MDPRIGQSLGIFRVAFAHDFDDRGKPLESAPANQPPQHAGKAAKAAWQALKDFRIMGTRIQAFLDRDGEIGAQKVKEKIAENEAKLKRSTAARFTGYAKRSQAERLAEHAPPTDPPSRPKSTHQCRTIAIVRLVVAVRTCNRGSLRAFLSAACTIQLELRRDQEAQLVRCIPPPSL